MAGGREIKVGRTNLPPARSYFSLKTKGMVKEGVGPHLLLYRFRGTT